MDQFVIKRNGKSIEGFEYKRLAEEESSIGGEVEVQPHLQDMRHSNGFAFCCRRLKPKLKYVPLIILALMGILYCTSRYWLPRPRPIVWSDSMTRIIYPKSGEQLVDRLVHLDLKGAPPRAEYLQKLFPMFKKWGATGLLIEWEDTFPYHDTLQNLRQGDAYDDQTTKSILEAARAAGLKVIPLVQTFGHMEWVLKHKEHAGVREITRYPQVICPSNNQSLELVKRLIDDIVKTHKGYIDTIHIGADEAYNVATECQRCKKRVEQLGAVDRLMLEYVAKVASYVKAQHNLRVLMWNDMFEKTEPSVLRSYRLHELVEPVIWGYAEYLLADDYFAHGVFKRFGETFDRLWIASAFKGANGPDQSFVDVRKYAQNHLGWMQVMEYYKKPLHGVKGIILTGWQRFDHFAILCELLPQAIPSLVFNLQVIKYGGMKPEIFENTRKALNCRMAPKNWTEDMPEWEAIVEAYFNDTLIKLRPRPNPPMLGTIRCDFPGSEVFGLVERLRLVKHEYELFMNTSVRRGWFSEYNIYHQYGSIYFAEKAFNVTEVLTKHFSLLGHELQVELSKIYHEDTINEWLYENIAQPLEQLKKLSLGLVQIKQTVEFRNRPLERMKFDL